MYVFLCIGHKFRVAKKGQVALNAIYDAKGGITKFSIKPEDLVDGSKYEL